MPLVVESQFDECLCDLVITSLFLFEPISIIVIIFYGMVAI